VELAVDFDHAYKVAHKTGRSATASTRSKRGSLGFIPPVYPPSPFPKTTLQGSEPEAIGQFNFVQSLVSPLEVKVRDPEVCAACRIKDCIRGRGGIPGCELHLFQPRKAGNMDCTFCLDCIHACPHDNIGMLARPPGRDLWHDAPRSGVGPLGNRITVFTAPTLLRAGPVDVSVFVQAAATGEPASGVQVTLKAAPRGSPAAASYHPATTEAATNKLYHAATFDLPEPGWYSVEVSIDGALGEAQVRFELEAAEPLPQCLAMWPWVSWPGLAIVVFAIHQVLVRRALGGKGR
jgi:hypothetical protein